MVDLYGVDGIFIALSTLILYYFAARLALLMSRDFEFVVEVLENDYCVITEGFTLFDRCTLV